MLPRIRRSARPCACCHHLAALSHALAGPVCALRAVQAAALERQERAILPCPEAKKLFDEALARLSVLWQQGRGQAAQACHRGPCPACGETRCCF